MKTQILSMYPDFTNEEVQSVIEEYNQDKTEVCSCCREEVTELESRIEYSGDYYYPSEYSEYCPHCGEEEPTLEKPTIEEYLFITQ